MEEQSNNVVPYLVHHDRLFLRIGIGVKRIDLFEWMDFQVIASVVFRPGAVFLLVLFAFNQIRSKPWEIRSGWYPPLFWISVRHNVSIFNTHSFTVGSRDGIVELHRYKQIKFKCQFSDKIRQRTLDDILIQVTSITSSNKSCSYLSNTFVNSNCNSIIINFNH